MLDEVQLENFVTGVEEIVGDTDVLILSDGRHPQNLSRCKKLIKNVKETLASTTMTKYPPRPQTLQTCATQWLVAPTAWPQRLYACEGMRLHASMLFR